MTVTKKRIQMHKKYSNGDVDKLYPIVRSSDVQTDENGGTLEAAIGKLDNVQEGATKVEESATNGNIKINGEEKTVYTHPSSGVTAGSYNKVTVDAKGHVTEGTNVTDWSGTVSGDASNGTVTFTAATARSNISSGEKLSALFGKISKYFTDLKALAFLDKVGTNQLDDTLLAEYNKRITTDNVTTSTSITEAGWVADARAVASMQNQITTINSNIDSLTGATTIEIAANFSEEAPYTQTINVTGVKTTDRLKLWSGVDETTSASDAKAWDKMASMINYMIVPEDGKITFGCLNKKPTSAFKVKITGIEGGV